MKNIKKSIVIEKFNYKDIEIKLYFSSESEKFFYFIVPTEYSKFEKLDGFRSKMYDSSLLAKRMAKNKIDDCIGIEETAINDFSLYYF